MDRWERLDKLVNDLVNHNKELAKQGKHNYGCCCLCGKIHYSDLEPNLNKDVK